jgi:hypothetical protein
VNEDEKRGPPAAQTDGMAGQAAEAAEVAAMVRALATAKPADREKILRRIDAAIENKQPRDPESYRAARRGLEVIRAVFVDLAPGAKVN